MQTSCFLPLHGIRNSLRHLNKLSQCDYSATTPVVPIAQAFYCRVENAWKPSVSGNAIKVIMTFVTKRVNPVAFWSVLYCNWILHFLFNFFFFWPLSCPLYAIFRLEWFRETVVSFRFDLQSQRFRILVTLLRCDLRYKQRPDVSTKSKLEQKYSPWMT